MGNEQHPAIRLATRFWSRVDRQGLNDCWEWTGPTTGSQAYGAFCFDSGYVYAHRFSYILTHGEIPDDQVVMHTCDNPPCVNPLHLKLSSQGENIRDSVDKGRWMSVARKRHMDILNGTGP